MGVFPSPFTFPSPGLYPEDPTPLPAAASELLAGRRAFTVAQALFAGAPLGQAQLMSVGWHSSEVNPESGSFAVVQQNADLDDLVGEILSITSNGRTVYAYVLDTADVPVQVSVTRRVFLALNRLTIEALPASVVAVDG